MACSNFKKGLQMAYSPLGLSLFQMDISLNGIHVNTRPFLEF